VDFIDGYREWQLAASKKVGFIYPISPNQVPSRNWINGWGYGLYFVEEYF
jgi:hypothetical protein